jgi:hypothetical protein
MAQTTEQYVYTSVLKRAAAQNIMPNKTKDARDWFRRKAADYRGPRLQQNKFFESATLSDKVLPGRMYMYIYDAKHKEKLPYWDAFPLIFMVGPADNGFYGLNLHYLQPVLRARLMDALYTVTNNQKYDDSTKLNISYQTLKGASNLALFKPCFKHYLANQVKSRFIYVEPKDWDTALFLPTQKFQKASTSTVWKDSRSGF